MKFKNILVAVDGSKSSLNAATYAIDLAKRFEAKLFALYVIDLKYNELEMALSPRAERYKEITNVALEKAQLTVNKVRQKADQVNVDTDTDVISAVTSVVKDIIEYAKKKEMDLIVVGSRGMTGFKKMLLGSVASGIVTYARCSVMVVK
jgi:nucleotide-binding universal stress UspA family protein